MIPYAQHYPKNFYTDYVSRSHKWALCPPGFYLKGIIFISVIQAPSYITSKRQNAAVRRITQIVMTVVTTKMLPFPSITKVGINVNRMDTTWLASVKAAAISITALKNSNAAR